MHQPTGQSIDIFLRERLRLRMIAQGVVDLIQGKIHQHLRGKIAGRLRQKNTDSCQTSLRIQPSCESFHFA